MNSTSTPGLSLPSHFTYERYEPNHTVDVAKNQRLGLPSGLISDLRNALDAVMHGKNPEQASKHLLADLRRLHQHFVPERSPEHPRNQPHQPLIMTVDDLKAQAKLAEQLQNDPNLKLESLPGNSGKKGVTVDDLKAQVKLAEQLQNDPNLKLGILPGNSGQKGVTDDDLKAQARLAEQLQNDPNVIRDLEGRKVDLASWDALTEHASFLHDHPVADKVICELRAFLDADRSGKDIDRFVAALRTDLEAFLANTQRSDADLQLELMAALRNT
ncbi:hypothetical protein ACK129_04810 [Pseudomonas citrulli]|uniref:hypothetical protein n=1 Tax=Pseudomonas citrulli TaxID=3064347 RepID=UPI003AD4C36E